jgi:HTH-type transcriptional regulator / antitoxin HigA
VTATATADYRKLLAQAAPTAIHSEQENERAIALLEELSCKAEPTPAQQQLVELLSILIQDFEEKHYQLKPANPLQVLTELMESHGLRQKDLVDVFRTPSIVSEVLRAKRALTTEHIRKLAEKFHVSPAVFI